MTDAVVKLTSLMGNSQKLDGGAMFGNVPKALWEKWASPDERNRITLACRTLLVQTATQNILLETGVGAFFEPRLKDRFGVVESEHCLLEGLASCGLSDADIDIVILSHLHFDHAGGLLSSWSEESSPRLLFPNARFIVSEVAWKRAQHPHARDKASFIPILNELLAASGRLHPIPSGDKYSALLPKDCFSFHYSEGHTPGMLLTEITTLKGPVIFAADLIPGTAWVHVPVTMGYDRYPEKLIDEKQAFICDLHARNGFLFYTHDPQIALSAIKQEAKGKYSACDSHSSLLGWGTNS